MSRLFPEVSPANIIIPVGAAIAMAGWWSASRQRNELRKGLSATKMEVLAYQGLLSQSTARAVEAENQAEEQRELALKDPLTKLANRAFFDEELKLEVERMRRYSRPTSALFLDLDGFKNINDTHGHAAGDEALRTVSGILSDRLRTSDIAARYGGDELVVLLPGDDETEAAKVAAYLHQEIKATPINFSDYSFNVTTSIGVAEINPWVEFKALLGEADQALYAAKKQGRNQVMRYSEIASAS